MATSPISNDSLAQRMALDDLLIPAHISLPDDELGLPPLPEFMEAQPFGLDDRGSLIKQVRGSTIVATVEQMQHSLARKLERELPAAMNPRERAIHIARAKENALADLLNRLNHALNDTRFQLTSQDLLDPGRYYSYEFNLFINDYARDLCGDPNFYFHRGVHTLSGAIISLIRPLPLQQVYNLLPRFTAKISDADVRVVGTTSNSATIRWHGQRQISKMPVAIHRRYIRMACRAYQGAYSAAPRVHSGLQPAHIRETHCQLDGGDYCEWELTWHEPRAPLFNLFSRRVPQNTAPVIADKNFPSLAADGYTLPHLRPESELGEMPHYIQGAPYGADESGKPISHIRGTLLFSAIQQLYESTAARVDAELSPALSPQERAARIEQAQSHAFDELVQRINQTIVDPRYRLTRDYLSDANHYYSYEFNLFVNVIARQICGDPHFFFHRGVKSVPRSLISLARPLSVRQIYNLIPRFTAKVIDDDIRVARVSSNSAVIQWYPHRLLERIPPALHRHSIYMTCRAYQGAYSSIPLFRDGLPLAQIQELRCALDGHECCEWEFKWDDVKPRAWFGSRAKNAAASEAASPIDPAEWTPTPRPDTDLQPMPARLKFIPFGMGEDGRLIRHSRGTLALASINQMLDCVGRRAAQEIPADLSPQERAGQVSQAQDAAISELVERLNAAAPHARQRIDRQFLSNDSQYYSHEFNFYLAEFARDICGDPNFFFHRGLRGVPSALRHLVRPLSLSQVYNLVPRFIAKFSDTDIRVVRVLSNSAVLQWHPQRQLKKLPAEIHQRFKRFACESYQGLYSSLPKFHSAMPIAVVKSVRCAMDGDEYCEWEFTWQMPPQPRTPAEIVGGAALAVAALIYFLLRLPAWEWLAGIALGLPLLVGWMRLRLRHVSYERERQEVLLLEQRDRSEEQYDALQQSNANLQLSNVALQQKISEITTLYEVNLTLSDTFDTLELLEKSLNVVTTHLHFDRGMVMIVDQKNDLLRYAHSIGFTPDMVTVLKQMDLPLDPAKGSLLPNVMRSGTPMLVSDDLLTLSERARYYFKATQTRAFLVTPLLAKGKQIGVVVVVVVDNAPTGRPIPESARELLFTIGTQIANAVDSAQLYETLERRVEERTREAEEARAVAEAASRSKS